MYQVIRIAMKSGRVVVWEKDDWDDYVYDGKFFVVTKKGKWIGFYNLDCIAAIAVD